MEVKLSKINWIIFHLLLQVAKKIQTTIGDVNILFNNAGIFHCRPFVHHTGNQMQRIIQINLIGEQSYIVLSPTSIACGINGLRLVLAWTYVGLDLCWLGLMLARTYVG